MFYIKNFLTALKGTSRARFLRQYLNICDQVTVAVQQYVNDVKSNNFPSDAESYE